MLQKGAGKSLCQLGGRPFWGQGRSLRSFRRLEFHGLLPFPLLTVCVNNNILNMFAFCFFAARASVYAIYFCTFFAPYCSFILCFAFFLLFPARLQSMPAGWAMYNLCLSLASYRLSLELNSWLAQALFGKHPENKGSKSINHCSTRLASNCRAYKKSNISFFEKSVVLFNQFSWKVILLIKNIFLSTFGIFTSPLKIVRTFRNILI